MADENRFEGKQSSKNVVKLWFLLHRFVFGALVDRQIYTLFVAGK